MSNHNFMAALGRHGNGSVVEDADELMQQAVRAVITNGGKATVTVKLHIKPNGDDGGALKIEAECGSTLPKRTYSSAFYWGDEDGHLSRNPPKDAADNLLRSIPSGAAKA